MQSQSRRVPARPLAAPMQQNQHQQPSPVRSAQRHGHSGNGSSLPSPNGRPGAVVGSPAGQKTPKGAPSKAAPTKEDNISGVHTPSMSLGKSGSRGNLQQADKQQLQLQQQLGLVPSSESASGPSEGGGGGGASKDYLDYTNTSFPPLEPPSEISFEKYCGPTPESNWVVRDKLLVGAYPASQSDMETFELLISILKLGVTSFVCLQQEYRIHGVTEAMWRSGQALRPYFEDAKVIVRNKLMFKSLADHPNVVDLEALDFVHFPIKDCSVTDDAAVLGLAQSLVARLHRGERLYVHCWGGHGRTGTVVCIMLHLMYGLDAQSAMNYCQYVHDLRQCHVEVGSPQTETQRMQVRRVIAALTQHRLSAHIYMQMRQMELEAEVESPNESSGNGESVGLLEGPSEADAAALPQLVQAAKDSGANDGPAHSVVESNASALAVVPVAPMSPSSSKPTRGGSGRQGHRGVSYVSTTSSSSVVVSSAPSSPGEGSVVAHRSSKSELVIVQQHSTPSSPESVITTQVSMQTTECEYTMAPGSNEEESGQASPSPQMIEHKKSFSMVVTSPSQSALCNHDIDVDTETADTVYVETTAVRLRVDAVVASQKSDAIVHSHHPLNQPLALTAPPPSDSVVHGASSPYSGRRASNAALVGSASKSSASTVHMELQIPRVVVNEPPAQFAEEQAATHSELASMMCDSAVVTCDSTEKICAIDDSNKLSVCGQNTLTDSCVSGGSADHVLCLQKLGGVAPADMSLVTKSQEDVDTETEGEEDDDEDARTEELSNASVTSETAAERAQANFPAPRCWPKTLRPQPPQTPRPTSKGRSNSKAASPGPSTEDMSRCQTFSLLTCMKPK